MKLLAAMIAFATFSVIIGDSSAQPVTPRGTPEAKPSRPEAPQMRWSVQKVNGRVMATAANAQPPFIAFADKHTAAEDTRYEIASLVGDVLSVREWSSWQGGAHPGHLSRIRSLQLTTRKVDQPITALFPERDVVAALLHDAVVARALKGASAATVAALIAEADGGCDVSFDELATSFAFHHVRGDEVAVRFGLPHGREAMRGHYTEIGVYLPIPVRLRGALDGAAQRGQLMQSRRSLRPR